MTELLDEKIQNEIDGLIDEAYEKLKEGNYDEYSKLINKAWDLYPEPKTKWSEMYNTAKYIFEDHMDIKKYDEAKIWLNHMIENNNINHDHDGDLEFKIGKYKFDTELFEEAYKMFREAVRQSGKSHFRYFEGEDPKYLEFYKKQKKLEDKK